MFNVVYFETSGGLGNQLFQVAEYLKNLLIFKDRKIKLIASKSSYKSEMHEYERINHFLGGFINVGKYGLFETAISILGRVPFFDKKFIIYSDDWWFENREFNITNTEYFDKVVIVKSLFQKLPEKKVLDLIKDHYENSRVFHRTAIKFEYCAMHIRLGDYVRGSEALKNISPVSSSYYIKCLNKIQSKGLPIFIVTDGSYEEVVNLIGEIPKKCVMTGISDIESFDLMVRAKYLAITNSSFSLWAAYLGNSSEVYCPNRWVSPPNRVVLKDYKKLYKEGWIVVSE